MTLYEDDVWRSVSDFFLVQNDIDVDVDAGRTNTSRNLDFFYTVGRFVVEPQWIFIIWLEFALVYTLAQQIMNGGRLVAWACITFCTGIRRPNPKRLTKAIMHWPSALASRFDEQVGREILSERSFDDDDEGLPIVVAPNAYAGVARQPAYKPLSRFRSWHFSLGSILPDKTRRGVSWSKPIPTVTHPVFKYLFKYAHGDGDHDDCGEEK